MSFATCADCRPQSSFLIKARRTPRRLLKQPEKPWQPKAGRGSCTGRHSPGCGRWQRFTALLSPQRWVAAFLHDRVPRPEPAQRRDATWQKCHLILGVEWLLFPPYPGLRLPERPACAGRWENPPPAPLGICTGLGGFGAGLLWAVGDGSAGSTAGWVVAALDAALPHRGTKSWSR